MDIKRKVWTDEEVLVLKNVYKLYSRDELAEMFNTSKNSISAKLQALGLVTKEHLPEGLKRCPVCHEVKPKSEFPRKGNGRFIGYCRECDKERKSEYFHEKRVKEILSSADTSDIRRHKIREEYIEKNKDKVFYCKYCKKEHTLDDYYVIVNKRYDVNDDDGVRYSVSKRCKARDNKISNRSREKRLKNKGYV